MFKLNCANQTSVIPLRMLKSLLSILAFTEMEEKDLAPDLKRSEDVMTHPKKLDAVTRIKGSHCMDRWALVTVKLFILEMRTFLTFYIERIMVLTY